MATVFSGNQTSATFTGDTKANIISAMQSALTSAGWTVASGGGTTNLLMQTAQDPTTHNQGRVRFKDNGGNCVQVTIENVSGTKAQTQSTNVGGNLLPATGKTFRLLCSKYRFEVFTPGSTAAREFVCAGILWIPAPYQSVITEAIYTQANSQTDTTSSVGSSFRTALGVSGVVGNCAGICNGALIDHNNQNGAYASDVQLRVPSNANPSSGTYTSGSFAPYANMYRWHDLALDMADPLMGWGNSSVSDEALIRGQVYDWTIASDAFTVDYTDSWSDGGASHNWWGLTQNNTGGSSTVRGTIFVAIS